MEVNSDESPQTSVVIKDEIGTDVSDVLDDTSQPADSEASKTETTEGDITVNEDEKDIAEAVANISTTAAAVPPPYSDMEQVRAACEQIITPENCGKMTIKMAKQKLCEYFNANYEEIDKYRSEIKNVVKEIGSAVSLAAAAANEDDEEEESDEVARRRVAKRPAAVKKSSPKGIKRQQARLMTKAFFVKNGDNMDLTLGTGVSEKCVPKEFSTGSCGWGLSKKVSFRVGDKDVQCQLSVNCIAVGSKQWAERESNEEEDDDDSNN